MDTYFITDKGRLQWNRGVPVRSDSFEDRLASHLDLALLSDLKDNGASSYDTLVQGFVGQWDLGHPYEVTEQHLRSSLRRLYEAGLADREPG